MNNDIGFVLESLMSFCGIMIASFIGALLVMVLAIVYIKYMIPAIKEYKLIRLTKRVYELKDEVDNADFYLFSQDDLEDRETEIQAKLQEISNLKPPIKKVITPETIEVTEKVKEIVDLMVSVETYSIMKRYISTGKKYNVLEIDKDITAISEKVYSGLNKAVYETELVFTNAYLMNYIVGQTFNLMLKITSELNIEISNG